MPRIYTRKTHEERILEKVALKGDCWVYTGFCNKGGYGIVTDPVKYFLLAHRMLFRAFFGDEFDFKGAVTDHLCRNTSCVNPFHLEMVTHTENILRGIGPTAVNARKTHCNYGHSLDLSLVYVGKKGGRACRVCRRRTQMAYVARKKKGELKCNS